MKVELFGTDWCTKTSMIKNHLQSEWIDFTYFNVDLDQEAADRIRAIYDGKLKFPVLIVYNSPHKNPGIAELRELFS